MLADHLARGERARSPASCTTERAQHLMIAVQAETGLY
jgi:hypothetical protein